MAARFTQEQLDKLDKETIIRLFLGLQEQSEELTREVHDLNEKMQLMLEQLVLSKKNRFGRSTVQRSRSRLRAGCSGTGRPGTACPETS